MDNLHAEEALSVQYAAQHLQRVLAARQENGAGMEVVIDGSSLSQWAQRFCGRAEAVLAALEDLLPRSSWFGGPTYQDEVWLGVIAATRAAVATSACAPAAAVTKPAACAQRLVSGAHALHESVEEALSQLAST